MARVALALGDVGLAVPLQEFLEAAGHQVVWSPPLAEGPEALPPGGPGVDVVVLTESNARDLGSRLDRWRERDPPPALLAIVQSSTGRETAAAARAPMVAATAPPRAIAVAVDRALLLRWAGGLGPGFARGALGLSAEGDPARDAASIVWAARQVDFELVREALRGHAGLYAALTPMVDRLREMRALDVPVLDLLRTIDGAHTLKTIVRMAPGGAQQAGRLLWALACAGVISLSTEPVDLATEERRAVAVARRHLRARQARLERATHYDVLEVTPDAHPDKIDVAVRMLGLRYAPERLQALDLGDAAALVAPLWQAVLQARAILLDPADRLRYHDELRARLSSVTSVWVLGRPNDRARAEEHYARGQRALVAGEPFKAVSEMAAAARAHGDHPDYEASLAWARYRADLARGKPREEVAPGERQAAERTLLGRRPWPRALVALAMLCAADGDAEAARWHLREALACDPNLPAARQLLTRLGK